MISRFSTFLAEQRWSGKYKKSIDCSRPKGFSQRAHCQGKKKQMNAERMISRSSTFLAELFEQPWLHIDTTEVRAFGGRWLVNYIYADPKDPDNYQKHLLVVFEQQNSNSWELMFHRGGSFAAKGQGDASGVLASVLDATRKFLKKFDPEYITFSASKDKGSSRERAYAAMVKRFVSQYGYTVDYTASSKTDAIWKLKKRG